MLSIKIILDERSVKKDGTCPLKIRIIINRRSHHISLGYSIPAKEWDESNQRVKSSSNTVLNTTRFNNLLHKRKQEAYDILLKLQEEGSFEDISTERLKNHFTRNSSNTHVLEYGEEIIQELVHGRKIGNARVYRTMVSSFRTFLDGNDIPIRQINFAFIKKYEAWYLGKGNSTNGLSVHLRTLRALINRAVKEKRLEKDFNPFRDYHIKNEKTRKRAIKSESLDALRNFEPKTVRQKKAKNYFMFSFLSIGASFIDMAFLKISNIVEGRLVYKRRKTGRIHSIPLSEPILAIIKEFTMGKTNEDYIFNIITEQDPAKQNVQIKDELRRYNRTLKEIGQICGLPTPLTSYVSRHTYATIAKHKGVPTSVISEALGHASEEVTQVYLDSFDQETMDEFHKIVINA